MDHCQELTCLTHLGTTWWKQLLGEPMENSLSSKLERYISTWIWFIYKQLFCVPNSWLRSWQNNLELESWSVIKCVYHTRWRVIKSTNTYMGVHHYNKRAAKMFDNEIDEYKTLTQLSYYTKFSYHIS
jgi:hypothetical protein